MIRGREGNDLQLRDCLEFTLPLCRVGELSELGEVQRTSGNGNERERSHQDHIASGSCWSVYPGAESLITNLFIDQLG